MLIYNYANHTDYWLWRANMGSSEQPGVLEFTNPGEKGNFTNRSKILL